jgi:hypothetical protein
MLPVGLRLASQDGDVDLHPLKMPVQCAQKRSHQERSRLLLLLGIHLLGKAFDVLPARFKVTAANPIFNHHPLGDIAHLGDLKGTHLYALVPDPLFYITVLPVVASLGSHMAESYVSSDVQLCTEFLIVRLPPGIYLLPEIAIFGACADHSPKQFLDGDLQFIIKTQAC